MTDLAALRSALWIMAEAVDELARVELLVEASERAPGSLPSWEEADQVDREHWREMALTRLGLSVPIYRWLIRNQDRWRD